MAIATFVACGEQDQKNHSNPLLESWDTPFEIAPLDRIKADHYIAAFDVAFNEQADDIAYITNDSTEVNFGNTIVTLDNAGIRVSELKDLFEMSEAALSDKDWARVSEIIKPKLSTARDKILTNEKLFERVRTIYDERSTLGLNKVDMRLLEMTYNRFVRGGALLDAEQKQRLIEINSRIALLSSRFSSNLIAENDALYLKLGLGEVSGLNVETKKMAAEEAKRRGIKGGWVIGVNTTSMIPFLTQSPRRDLREKIYKKFLNRGANDDKRDNREIVIEVTRLRQEKAQLLGYKHHADYVISQQMAGDVDAAYDLLNRVWNPALETAKHERDEVEKLFKKDNPDDEFEAWDWWYYNNKYREKEYNISEDAIRPYFSVETTKAGLFQLANRLYGIMFRPTVVPLYANLCSAYEVVDRDGTHLGVLYFDLYTRSGKWQGAWCGNLREQRTDGGDRITPVVAMVCNFPRPSNNTPTLLTMEQVETLFHEFGHALHFLFQNVDYRSMSAALVEGDFVEFPSQLMENWAFEPSMLRQYAIHHRTLAPITESLITSITKLKYFNQGFETIAYSSSALLDLDLQTTTDFDNFDIDTFAQSQLYEKRGMISEIEPRYHLPYFLHLFGYDYSAGYYFYIWSEVLDKDCFEIFQNSTDIFSSEVANKLRREILSRGGEASGAELYRNFKGAEPSETAMLRSKGFITEKNKK